MSISERISKQLQQVLAGDPWYGSSVYTIIERISFEAAYEKPPGSVHNVAEIVLHMVAWTEEVMDRMNGLPSGVPTSGDWPETGKPDEQKWQNYVEDLKLVNVNLIGIIQKFSEEQWIEPTLDERNSDSGIGVTYEELINGLVQHHIYHSGQIALLNRIING
ncbi:DinB family protein [Mucilaginibacter sp. SP1R1]|uniref:DinB family protein n=1 Tax=Mucilaginibacter sp. SP1R1 TaxID=2723091 RepID=UPI00160DBD96|nr:DinB family protein [Mucilaginibacter sp. SP1R1]MBB6152152.1 putative damage-inducible protein DinB [Mucilaginibacter sp. SP1R1]